jgi:hypothetical protein
MSLKCINDVLKTQFVPVNINQNIIIIYQWPYNSLLGLGPSVKFLDPIHSR